MKLRISSLLPWFAAISCGAFAGSVTYAIFYDLWLTGEHNVLTVFRDVFPVAVVICTLIGMPVALKNTVSSRAASLSAIVAGSLAIALLLMFSFRLSDPIGIFLGFLFLVVLGFCLGISGLISAYVILWAAGVTEAIATRSEHPTFSPAHLRTWMLAVVALAPLATYAFHDTAHDYSCRYANRAVESALRDRGDIVVDLDRPDWAKFERVMEKFGVVHGMHLEGPDPWKLLGLGDPLGLTLCTPGRLVVGVSGWEDGGPGQFQATGDWYVDLRVSAPDSNTEWETTLKELLLALDTEWPGIKFQTSNLGPAFKQWNGADGCRSKVAKSEYRFCLGERSNVRKETIYMQGNKADWPRLQRVMREFGSAHGMAFTGVDVSGRKDTEPLGTKLCSDGRSLIFANPWSIAPAINQPPGWHVRVVTYAPETDQDSNAAIEQLISVLKSEWPDIVRSRPDPDFCRSLKQ